MNPSTSSLQSRLRKGSAQGKTAPIVYRNGRLYPAGEKNPYPLPCDARELSRQSLVHSLRLALMDGRNHCVDFPDDAVPRKVLDIGCGSGIWIHAMHEEFSARGYPNVEFVGMDIVPVFMDMTGINFSFVSWDLAHHPLPFRDEEFDFVMLRDLALGMTVKSLYDGLVQDCLRIIKAGGFFEIQEIDFTIRTLLRNPTSYIPGCSAYTITPMSQFALNPENPFIQQWNEYVTKSLSDRGLPNAPCTFVGPILLMEEEISGVQTKRLALPFDEVWWESIVAAGEDLDALSLASKRKSSGGSSTESIAGSTRSARKGSVSTQRRSSTSAGSGPPSPLTEEEKAIRHMARLTFTQMIEGMEVSLREATGLSLEDWDRWYKDLMFNFMQAGGLRGGECLEYGYWWGRKRERPAKTKLLGVGSA